MSKVRQARLLPYQVRQVNKENPGLPVRPLLAPQVNRVQPAQHLRFPDLRENRARQVSAARQASREYRDLRASKVYKALQANGVRRENRALQGLRGNREYKAPRGNAVRRANKEYKALRESLGYKGLQVSAARRATQVPPAMLQRFLDLLALRVTKARQVMRQRAVGLRFRLVSQPAHQWVIFGGIQPTEF